MNPRPLPRDTSSQDLELLADIDCAVRHLDQAFNQLCDRSFACLSRPYQRLGDAVLLVAVGPTLDAELLQRLVPKFPVFAERLDIPGPKQCRIVERRLV